MTTSLGQHAWRAGPWLADLAFTDVREPVYYGRDVADALELVRGFTCTGEALKGLDPAITASAGRASGRCALRAHERCRCLVQFSGRDRHRSSPPKPDQRLGPPLPASMEN